MVLQIIKKDENGCHSVKISVAIVGLILTILLAGIPYILAYGSLTENVDNIEKELEIKLPEYKEEINEINDRLIELEKIAAGTEVSLTTIERDINEIKIDLKNLIKEMRSSN